MACDLSSPCSEKPPRKTPNGPKCPALLWKLIFPQLAAAPGRAAQRWVQGMSSGHRPGYREDARQGAEVTTPPWGPPFLAAPLRGDSFAPDSVLRNLPRRILPLADVRATQATPVPEL